MGQLLGISHRLLHKATDSFHDRLVLRSQIYAKWHEQPHHRKVHLSILGIYCLIIAAIITQQFAPAYQPHSLASSGSWNFANTTDYTYDNTKVNIAGNQATLKGTDVQGVNWIANDSSGNSWPYRKAVTISHLNVGSTLTNFPAKVEIAADTDIGAHAKSDLTDLRFTLSDYKTILPAERETGAIATGSASGIFWVQVPSILSTADTVIYVYYGNTSASAQTSPSSVWDSNYKGVWHLGESANPYNDSTTNNNVSTSGTYPSQSDAIIGKGQSYAKASSQYISIPNSASLNPTAAITAQIWFKPVASTAPYMLFAKGDQPRIYVNDNSGNVYCNITINGISLGLGPFTATMGSWNSIGIRYDGANVQVYVNGLASGSPTAATGSITTNANPLTIGSQGAVYYYNGLLDEFKISDSARSADWIKFEYYNQKDTAGQLTFGAQTTVNLVPVTHAPGTDWIATDTGHDWPYRKAITISKTNVGSTLTNFPAKVEIAGDTDIGAHAKSDLTDLRFTSSGGATILPAERETGAIAAGSASGIFWVQVPSISSTADTIIYVYYGNAFAAAQANPNGVWDTNYKAIYHLSDPTNPTDSTGVNNGTNYGSTATAGNNDGGAAFVASSSQYISIPNNASLQNTSFSIDMWMQTSDANSLQVFAGKADGSNGYAIAYHGNNAPGNFGMYAMVQTGGVEKDAFSTLGALSINTWYHIVGTYDGTTIKLYRNGVLDSSTSVSNALGTSASILTIGRHAPTPYYVSGKIDEVRISNSARSADWIKFEYYNQKDAAGQLSYGSQSTLGGYFDYTAANVTAQSYNTVSAFSATTSGTGLVKFQVSPNSGTTWYWWNGSAWAATTNGSWEANTAADVNTHFADGSFNSLGTAPKTFKWRSFFTSDGSQQPILSGISLTYLWDTLAPSNPTLVPTSQKVGGTAIATGNFYNYANPYYGWTAVTDVANVGETPSGTAGYYIYYGTDNTALPTSARGMANELGGTGIHYQTTTGFEVGVDSTVMTTGNTYYLRAQTKDNAGNISAAATLFTYKYDSTAPSSPAYVSVSPSGYSRTNSFTFSWPVSGADGPSDPGVNPSGLLKYQYQLGTAGWVDVPGNATTASIAPTNPAYRTGANVFALRSVDVAGNLATPAQVTFYFNSSTPTAPTNLAVAPSTPSSSNSFAFSWGLPQTYTGSIAGYYYSINALPTLVNATFTASTSLAAAPFATQQGQNTFYIVAKDDAGNVDFDSCNAISGNPTTDGCAKVNFTANTSAPGIPTGLQAVDTSNRDAALYSDVLKWIAPVSQGTGFAGYSIERSIDNINFAQVATTSGTSYVDDNLQSQLYYYRLRSKDNASQYSAYSAVVSITPTGRYTTPPALTDGPTAAPKAFSISVSWQTDRESSSFVEYGLTANTVGKESGGKTIGALEQSKKHAVTVDGLQPDTLYYYRSVWLDSDGNRGQSDVFNLRTSPAPSIAEVKQSNVTLNSMLITWQTNVVANCAIIYGPSTAYGGSTSEISGVLAASHSLNLTGLNDSTTYHFKASCTDADSNQFISDDYSQPTLVRPIISNLKSEPVKDAPTTTIRFTFSTNIPTTTIVSYQNGTGSTLTQSNAEPKTDHDIQVKDLADKTTYTFQASGVDQHGNTVASDKVSFATPNDTRPPKVSNLSIEVKAQGFSSAQKAQVVASWTTDEPSTSWLEYGQGITSNDYPSKTSEDQTLTNSHVIIVGELEPSKIYHLRVGSRDAAGNAGYSSDTTTITGKIQRSVIDIIITSLQKSLGWLFGLSFGR